MNNITDWHNKRVLVTGGSGFLGSYIVNKLRGKGCANIFSPRSRQYDLTDSQAIRKLLHDTKPEIVIHLAAVVGGIGANRKNPAKYFYENLMMGVQLMHESYIAGVDKFVAVGTICSYPKFCPVPFKEADFWNGYPEETNAPYGLAKKMLTVGGQAYRQQYDFNAINLLCVNLYGPKDNFNPESSHVIPALIKKFIDARDNGLPEVPIWGDGSPTREFIFAADAADGIILATEKYNKPDPINIGTNFEIKIADLAEAIKKECHYEGNIIWDSTKPNGQPRRCLDVSKAREEFNFTASTSFHDGLKETISWYESHKQELEFNSPITHHRTNTNMESNLR